MLRRQDIIGQRIAAVFESQHPERVSLADIPEQGEFVYYRWFLQLTSGTFLELKTREIGLVAQPSEPVCKARVNLTKWVVGNEFASRGYWASKSARQEFIQTVPFVCDHVLLSAEATQKMLAGQEITEVIVGARLADPWVILILNERNHLANWDQEGGNLLQLHALDEHLDLASDDEEKCRRYFENTPCDFFGRALVE